MNDAVWLLAFVPVLFCIPFFIRDCPPWRH